MNYDPNLIRSGKIKQTIKLIFGMWEYRKEVEIEVGGNLKGLSVIDHAIYSVFESLPYRQCPDGDVTTIVLSHPNGDTLECDDDEMNGEDWLHEMLISAEIVAISEGAAA